MLCTFETLIHWAGSQWHLNKDPNCSPLGPLWKSRSLHLQMPQSLATPASTSMSQEEERQKSLPILESLHGQPMATTQRHWGFSGVSTIWAWGAALSGYTEQCFIPLQWLSCMSKRMFPSVSNAVQCFPPDCKFSSWSCVSAPCLWVVLNLNLLFVQPTLLVGCFKFNFTFWRIFDISTRFPSFLPFFLLPQLLPCPSSNSWPLLLMMTNNKYIISYWHSERRMEAWSRSWIYHVYSMIAVCFNHKCIWRYRMYTYTGVCDD